MQNCLNSSAMGSLAFEIAPATDLFRVAGLDDATDVPSPAVVDALTIELCVVFKALLDFPVVAPIAADKLLD
jgi:hypothetical protein